MFKKLYTKIYVPLMVLSVALIMFIDVFAGIVETSAMKDAYTVAGNQKLERIITSYKLYISSAEMTTYNLSLDNTVIDELYYERGKSLLNVLENACNFSLKYNAVCAYSASGKIYTSAQIAQPPSLNDLKKDKGISDFIEGDEESYVSLRTHNVAGVYNAFPYPQGMGVITCCRKVYKDGEVAGYIFTDILPSNFYSYVFGNGQFDDAVAFITTNDGYFEYGANTDNASLLTGRHSGYFKYSSTQDDGLYTLTVFESKKSYGTQLAVLVSVLVGVSALLITAVHFTARATAKSVTDRLDRFLNKMNSSQLQ